MTYPHYLHLLDQLDPDVSLYYNIDDYTRYWPRHAERIRELERKLVLRATATVCVARFRADELRAAVPEAAAKIHHIPHGTPASFLAEHPARRPGVPPADIAHLPRPLLGYVGSIENRVDWHLMKKLSEAFPEASIVVVGRCPHFSRLREPWSTDWTEFSIGQNVHPIGWRPQESLPRYYESFDAILMPYAPIILSTRRALRPRSWTAWDRAGRSWRRRFPSAVCTGISLMSPTMTIPFSLPPGRSSKTAPMTAAPACGTRTLARILVPRLPCGCWRRWVIHDPPAIHSRHWHVGRILTLFERTLASGPLGR